MPSGRKSGSLNQNRFAQVSPALFPFDCVANENYEMVKSLCENTCSVSSL